MKEKELSWDELPEYVQKNIMYITVGKAVVEFVEAFNKKLTEQKGDNVK